MTSNHLPKLKKKLKNYTDFKQDEMKTHINQYAARILKKLAQQQFSTCSSSKPMFQNNAFPKLETFEC